MCDGEAIRCYYGRDTICHDLPTTPRYATLRVESPLAMGAGQCLIDMTRKIHDPTNTDMPRSTSLLGVDTPRPGSTFLFGLHVDSRHGVSQPDLTLVLVRGAPSRPIGEDSRVY